MTTSITNSSCHHSSLLPETAFSTPKATHGKIGYVKTRSERTFDRLVIDKIYIIDWHLSIAPWQSLIGSRYFRGFKKHRYTQYTAHLVYSVSTLQRRQTTLEIRFNINNIFKTHGDTYQTITNTCLRSLFIRQATVSGGCWMDNGGFSIA